jgi:hypothetical protein
MMHVEINYGDTVYPMLFTGMGATDGNTVENAEAHWNCWFRVMSWRSYGAESIVYFTIHDGVHGGANRTGCP